MENSSLYDSQKPRLITHAAHHAHPLTLLSSPPYPTGLFSCNACGLPDSGFCYHCSACNFDLHTLCAFTPPSVHNQAYHRHPLRLMFSAPNCDRFECDICHKLGESRYWFYWCESCDFAAHLGCASIKSQMQLLPHSQGYNDRSAHLLQYSSKPPISYSVSLPEPRPLLYPPGGLVYNNNVTHQQPCYDHHHHQPERKKNGFIYKILGEVTEGVVEDVVNELVGGLIGGGDSSSSGDSYSSYY